jgi:RNase P/RNase MRP subunit p30
MKRTFADLHLQIDLGNMTMVERIIGKIAQLGFGLVGVPLPPEIRENEMAKLREICREANISLVNRVDLRPKSRGQLMNQLRKLRRKFEVICVLCENKEVARQAAKDRRVDLLNFPALGYTRRFFDWAEAELASKSLCVLEIDVKPMFVLEGPARVRLLSCLRREITIAKEFHIPVIVSSGASSGSLLRKPLEIAAFAGLFGLTETSGLDAVSTNPSQIVERNRAKLAHGFVAPGIRVVKESVDC